MHCTTLIPLATKRPMVATVHDVAFLHYPEFFTRRGNRVFRRSVVALKSRAAKVLCSSSATLNDLRDLGFSEERLRFVPLGVRHVEVTDEDRARVREKLSLPSDYLLFVGTLEPRKNVDRLVRAFARLVRDGLPHSLVLAGGRGWDYAAIDRAVADEGIGHRVIIPGYVRREDQPLWYSAADLFTYPSQYEGFGLPVLEALACGTPVVTSNSSSLPEVVGRAGLVIDPSDESSLAEAMRSVLTDGTLAARLRDAGPVQAAQFSWARSAAGCVRAYREAAADASQGGRA